MKYLTITPLEQNLLPIYQKPYYFINELFLTLLKIKEKLDDWKHMKNEIKFYRTLANNKKSPYSIAQNRNSLRAPIDLGTKFG